MRNIIHALWHLPPRLAICIIESYRQTLSPDHGPLKVLYPYGFCRHTPTCSAFAQSAIGDKGVLLGTLSSLLRLLCCTPWKKPSEERIMEVCYGEWCHKDLHLRIVRRSRWRLFQTHQSPTPTGPSDYKKGASGENPPSMDTL